MNRLKRVLLTAGVLLAMAFTFSCSSGDDDNDNPGGGGSTKGSFTDPRDGQSYGTVTIGGKTWMAKNLNYDASGSVCYDDQSSYCNEYGKLYNWEAAMTACPNGWHLPSIDEWDVLVNSVGGSSTAGKHLKATSGWDNNGNGLNTYGFAALPGGDGNSVGDFDNVGYYGSWWSSNEDGSNNAYSRRMGYNGEYVYPDNSLKHRLFSVRCVQD